MKVDVNPFPKDQNMVDAKLLKGKTKVLTSTMAKETRTVDPEMQISADEYKELKGIVTNRKANMSRERHQEMR